MIAKKTIFIPGKIMLAGEYAVLNGGRALAATISKGMTVSISNSPQEEPGFKVSSDLWEKPIQVLSPDKIVSFANNPLCETVAFAMHHFGLQQGSISVQSNLDVTHGVGTSSAIRLGVLLAFREFATRNKQISDIDVARLAYELQKQSQSVASGYDIITQLLGGLVTMQPPKKDSGLSWPGEILSHAENILATLQNYLHIYVGGKGAPTEPVAKKTLQWIEKNELAANLFSLSEDLIDEFNNFFSKPTLENLQYIVKKMAEHRILFETSPCFPSYIGNKLKKVAGCDQNWSFKTSGAGGEDALIVLGEKNNLQEVNQCLHQLGWELMPYQFSFNKAQSE